MFAIEIPCRPEERPARPGARPRPSPDLEQPRRRRASASTRCITDDDLSSTGTQVPDEQIARTDVTPDDFGRIAAQTAKQVIQQRIREAEREIMYEE